MKEIINVLNKIEKAIREENKIQAYNDTTRPNAGAVGQGYIIYNTDDNAPNISDGTNWRDAMGNIT